MNTEDRGWKISVLSAVQEVMNHPRGGEVRVQVRVFEGGKREIKPFAHLNGKSRETSSVDMTED